MTITTYDLEEYKITERYISPGVGRLWQASNSRGPWEECKRLNVKWEENKMEDVKRVYVAGAYSADNVITVLDNMRIGMRVATEILLKGYSPFVPWFDFHFQLMLRENESLTVEDYYKYSIDWLEVSDVLYVLPNSEHSKGTQAEIEFAKENNIPIIYDINELKGLNDGV